MFEIEENHNLELTCEAQDANPSIVTYVWKKEDGTVTVNSSYLRVNNIKNGDDGIKFTCIATNTMTPTDGAVRIGTGTRPVTLSVIRKHQMTASR